MSEHDADAVDRTTPPPAPEAVAWTPMDPRARPLLWLEYTAGVAVAGVPVAAIAALVARSWFVLGAVVAAAVLVGVPVGRWLADLRLSRSRHRREGWTLVEHDGALIHHERHVPVVRIQHVDLREGVLDQQLGLAGLTIHTAAPTADVTLDHLDADLARRVRADLLEAADVATASLDGDLRDGA